MSWLLGLSYAQISCLYMILESDSSLFVFSIHAPVAPGCAWVFLEWVEVSYQLENELMICL